MCTKQDPNSITQNHEKEDETSSSDDSNKKIGNYTLGKTIGEGTFGKVKIAIHEHTKEKVAMKILDKKKINSDDDLRHIQSEIETLKQIKHKNIIQLYEIIDTPEKLHIVMELADEGDLFEYITENSKLEEPAACRFFQQIINALEYLHMMNIVHRDIKPENMLMDFKKELKLSDFGLAKEYDSSKLLTTPCGTPSYASPELLIGNEYHGLFSDIWSAGVVLYAMVAGYLPFEDNNDEELQKKIIEGDYEIPNHFSREIRDLLKNVLEVNPHKRYDIKQIKQHPWFNLVTYTNCPGLNLKLHHYPIDEKILEKIEKIYDEDQDLVKLFLNNNEFNEYTTTYYLILKKLIKEGGNSISDLRSSEYINYIENALRNSKEDSITDSGISNENYLKIARETVVNLLDTTKLGLNKNTPKENIQVKKRVKGFERRSVDQNCDVFLNLMRIESTCDESTNNLNIPKKRKSFQELNIRDTISIDKKIESMKEKNIVEKKIEQKKNQSTKKNETKKKFPVIPQSSVKEKPRFQQDVKTRILKANYNKKVKIEITSKLKNQKEPSSSNKTNSFVKSTQINAPPSLKFVKSEMKKMASTRFKEKNMLEKERDDNGLQNSAKTGDSTSFSRNKSPLFKISHFPDVKHPKSRINCLTSRENKEKNEQNKELLRSFGSQINSPMKSFHSRNPSEVLVTPTTKNHKKIDSSVYSSSEFSQELRNTLSYRGPISSLKYSQRVSIEKKIDTPHFNHSKLPHPKEIHQAVDIELIVFGEKIHVLKKVCNAMGKLKILYLNFGNKYSLKCNKDGWKFTVDIKALNSTKISYLEINKGSGQLYSTNSIIASLLYEIKGV